VRREQTVTPAIGGSRPGAPAGAGPASRSTPATGSSHRLLRAFVAWFAVLAGTALALQLLVLAIDIGPLSLGTGAVIAASAIVAGGGGVAFWRLVGGPGGRRRLAAGLLVVAVGWAALSALMLAWLFAAFNP
jgi:hypothetical protein